MKNFKNKAARQEEMRNMQREEPKERSNQPAYRSALLHFTVWINSQITADYSMEPGYSRMPAFWQLISWSYIYPRWRNWFFFTYIFSKEMPLNWKQSWEFCSLEIKMLTILHGMVWGYQTITISLYSSFTSIRQFLNILCLGQVHVMCSKIIKFISSRGTVF